MLERRRNGPPGLTLVEILIVITLLGLLAALVGPRILGRGAEARSGTASAQTSWR